MRDTGFRVRGNLLVPGILLCLAALLLSSGCATRRLRGTPYYSDTGRARRNATGEPVNLWPLLYYRNPILEILWPLVESTEDYFALRPVLSVYGGSDEEKLTSVAWPIAQFDERRDSHRIFPVYWGRKRFAVFPLYWHRSDPNGREGVSDKLIPLWSHYRDPDGYSTHLVWPFFHVKNLRGKAGWRIWPLYGNYRSTRGSYRFYCWPLGHHRTWSGGNSEHAFLPLYYRRRGPNESMFLSLPYAQGRRGDDSAWRWVFPLFYHGHDPDSSRLITPLYWAGRNERSDSDWSVLVPAYVTARNGKDRFFASLLGGFNREGERLSWMALPLLSGGTRAGDSSSVWLAGPLAHMSRGKDRSASHLFPLYYHSRRGDRSTFLSIPWCCGREGADSSWQLLPPLFFRKKDADGKTLISLLYYWDAADRTFISPLLARWGRENGCRKTFVPPLLALHSAGERTSDLWMLAGMARWSWGEEPGARYLLPFAYYDKQAGTFVSPLAARWRHGAGTDVTMIPPALSWLTSRKKRKDLWIAGPLAHFSWGQDAGGQHVFPLYYANRKEGTFISPFAAGWRDGRARHKVCPLLLSGYSVNGDEKTLNILLGMFRQNWGGRESSGHLVPLYFYEGSKEFYTPLVGWNRDGHDGFFYPLTPLAGVYTGKRSGGWLFPLFSHKRTRATGNYSGTFLWGRYRKSGRHYRSGLFPVYGYRNDGEIGSAPETAAGYATYGKRFWSLPACWYQNRMTIYPDRRAGHGGKAVRRYQKRNGFFPIWSYSSRTMPEREVEDIEGSLLWFLYDYERRGRPDRERVRARVLWRLWHYERNNGNVEMDMFPAISYRRSVDGKKSMSFLWRLFRYERTDEGKKLDLLFIPIMR